MAKPGITESLLKKVLKEALVEVLEEQREMLYDIFSEVLEDLMLAQAIRESENMDAAEQQRSHLFSIMEGKA